MTDLKLDLQAVELDLNFNSDRLVTSLTNEPKNLFIEIIVKVTAFNSLFKRLLLLMFR